MLWNASAIRDYAIEATDGRLGSAGDLLFDDAGWIVRWLVVETGSWLHHRKVLLAASALGPPDRASSRIPVVLTMAQVEASPDVDTDQPVSRQLEGRVFDYYGWDPYWGHSFFPVGNAIAAPFLTPSFLADVGPMAPGEADAREAAGDPHLRSVAAVTGYHCQATDGEIGRVDDVLIDVANWSIRYLIVDTGDWWPGKRVLISPRSVRRIEWADRLFDLGLTRDKVKGAPPYDVMATVDGAYDATFHRYYGIDWTAR